MEVCVDLRVALVGAGVVAKAPTAVPTRAGYGRDPAIVWQQKTLLLVVVLARQLRACPKNQGHHALQQQTVEQCQHRRLPQGRPSFALNGPLDA